MIGGAIVFAAVAVHLIAGTTRVSKPACNIQVV
jgi:hypothetical protein